MGLPNPPIYPIDLPGLTWNLIRRPKAGSTSVQSHVSGREVRVGYWAQPMWEWEFTYDLLRDFPWAAIQSEMRRLQGFFLAAQGSRLPFYLQDPDDTHIIGQAIAIADGVTSSFLVTRTYGDPGFGATITEPVGNFDPVASSVYLNGVKQTLGVDFTVAGSPGAVEIAFASPPIGGVVITADLWIYHRVRFQSDSLDFERFAGADGAGFWMIKKVVLQSVRPEP